MGIHTVFAVIDLVVMNKYNWNKSEKNHHKHRREGGE